MDNELKELIHETSTALLCVSLRDQVSVLKLFNGRREPGHTMATRIEQAEGLEVEHLISQLAAPDGSSRVLSALALMLVDATLTADHAFLERCHRALRSEWGALVEAPDEESIEKRGMLAALMGVARLSTERAEAELADDEAYEAASVVELIANELEERHGK